MRISCKKMKGNADASERDVLLPALHEQHEPEY
jgi:hypothetical protein